MTTSASPLLAVIIPTYRFDPLAKDVLRQAAAMGCDDLLVHFGDNSECPEKHDFLRDLAARGTNVVVSCYDKNIGWEASWQYLIRRQSAPYICIAADDDAYCGAYFRAGLELVRGDPDCSAGSGLHLSVAHRSDSEGPFLSSPTERRETDPLERIRNYGGQNSLIYTVAKTSIVRDFADYVESNPLKCPFTDYMLAFHLLSIGTYRMDRLAMAYVYDNTKWHVNDDFIASNGRHYTYSGLPEAFGYITRLHWAVVVVHFFSSRFRHSGLSDERARAIVAYLFERQRREFETDYDRYEPTMRELFAGHADALAACRRLFLGTYTRIAAIFDDFERVARVFSPGVATAYRAFQAATLRPDADTIDTMPAASQRPAARIKRHLGLK